MKNVLVAGAILIGLLVATHSASAQSAQFPRATGNACQASDPTTAGLPLYRGGLGYLNFSTTTAAAVACPVAVSGTSLATPTVTANGARVYYQDGEPTSGRSVACSLQVVKGNNSYTVTATVYSCATAGGCSTGTNTFSGTGYLQLPAIASTADVVGVHINCNIPFWTSGGPSAILGYAASLTVL